ncbi:hypothetical protein POM88_008241 [Heracleum sosnowskyi]|uniref:Uncharacterized protein n=1 Tax=Heracleum sosnowskyi TaxID=360622 RepID=A0AAD8J6W8_9APIA|nr:hypothetical protein POM88_008241 [Heracleum sosnowskyi]
MSFPPIFNSSFSDCKQKLQGQRIISSSNFERSMQNITGWEPGNHFYSIKLVKSWTFGQRTTKTIINVHALGFILYSIVQGLSICLVVQTNRHLPCSVAFISRLCYVIGFCVPDQVSMRLPVKLKFEEQNVVYVEASLQ